MSYAKQKGAPARVSRAEVALAVIEMAIRIRNANVHPRCVAR